VAPEVSPDLIRIRFGGADRIAIDADSGTLLAQPDCTALLAVPVTGAALPLAIPDDDSWSGVRLFAQGLQLDSGAAQGVSFAPGLQLVLGI
jgi:hypothetical protein